MKPRLLLHCATNHSRFALSMQGEVWREQFNDLRTALDYAATIVTDDTPLLIHNEMGRVIVETVVSPDASRKKQLHG
jgi:hypothetical protein